MDCAHRVDLVHKAITLGNIEWKPKALEIMLDAEEMKGFTDRGVRFLLQDFVKQGGQVKPRFEKRSEYIDPDHPYWYRAVIPVPEFPKGLFVETLLLDHEEEADPFLQIVSAHRQH